MRVIQFFVFILIGLQYCSGQVSNKIDSKSVSQSQEVIIKIDTKDSLSISGVKAIPLDVFERSDLKYLAIWGQDCDVSGMECFAISEISNRIEELRNLEELHLTLNYITILPPEILKLKKLRVLDLAENPGFSDIDRVVQMTWLEEFYCFGCQLSEAELEKLKQKLPNCKIGIK